VEARHVLLAQDKIRRGQHTVLVVGGALRTKHVRLLVLRGRGDTGLSSPSLLEILAVWLFQIVQHLNFEAGYGGRRFVGLFKTCERL